MFRILRRFSTGPRRSYPYPNSFARNNGDFTVQHVHVAQSRAKRSSKRVALHASLTAIFCLFYFDTPWNPLNKVSVEVEGQKEKLAALEGRKTKSAERKDDTEEKKGEEKEEEEEEDIQIPDEMPEDATFIPLGFAKQLPQTFYKGTDPEWQSFIEFSKDKKRSQLVRNELAGLIGRHIASMKNFEKQLGKPIQPRKYWLDIDFPDGPPPAYERSGIEIADNYIAWTTRPVDPIQVSRLQSALWPKSIAVSIWSSYSTLWSLQVARAKQLLGIESEVKPQSTSTDAVDFQELAKGTKPQGKSSGANARPDANSDELSVVPSPNLSSADAEKASEAKQRLQSLGLHGVVTDFGSALTSFKNSLQKTWRFPNAPPERGTIMVSGLVELVGSKATCVIDVRAAFHPKDNRFVSVGLGVRRLQARKQAPKGGTGEKKPPE